MSEDAPTEPELPRERAIAHTAGKPALGSFPDRYAPGEELGRGGMGRVVEAHDRMLGRTVALKEALDADADALRRFARETQITARLEHPSIVPVYDAGVSPDGSPFYVMRKVTGRPLSKLVDSAASLDDRLKLLPHVAAACQAIAHAHERGIIHRDLKPSNILIGARGETIVIDWGLAKARGETDPAMTAKEPSAGESLRTDVNATFGTPGFMPPEQVVSADVDERADVYALGATLFYLLAKKAPFAAPPPIATLVPGTPRELATIVDKALAKHADARYANAGELATDLTQFMAGQLVASHVYSRREKVARFVRRHRALVVTVAAALAVLAVGAWFAVGRVLSARDEALAQARAAEAARKNETERASDLVVSQARLLLASNPAAAIAMVRPLAETSRWRDVRAIAAGARAAGVPWRLPGPSSVLSADLDGDRALAVGRDGSLHIYDLAKRSHEVVATLPARSRAVFADERFVVAWLDKTFTIVDLATKATRTVEAGVIKSVEGHAGNAYFVDDKGAPSRLTAATGELLAFPVDGRVRYVAPSPDGKHVAFAGEHLWMVETKRPDLVEKVHEGKKFELAWSSSGDHLAVFGERATYFITVHPEIEIVELGVTNQTLAIARGMLYSMGLSGFTIADRNFGSVDLTSSIVGMHVTKGEYVVAAGRGALRVFDGKHSFDIPVPASPIGLLRASPRSPYVFAIVADLVLVWNIEEVMPTRVEVPSYVQIALLGAHTAWTITNAGDGGRAIDLRTREVRPIAKLPPLRYASPASGAYLIARPLTSTDTLVVDRDGNARTLPFRAQNAIALDDKRALVVTEQSEVVVYDLASGDVQKVGYTASSPVNRLLARHDSARWAVATFDDGTLWRHDFDTRSSTTTRISPRRDLFSPALVTSAPLRDGDVFIASGARVRRWKPDGSIEDQVTLPRPIHSLDLIDDARIVVLADDGTGYLVDLRQRDRWVKLPPVGPSFSFAPGSPLIVTDDRSGGATMIDLEANAAWKIARATPQGSTPSLAGDASTVVLRDATMDSTGIAIWNLELPATPAETARWIAGMTNATFDPRTGMLGWAP